ncbi:MAG: hypothetical protein JNK82_07420 [Myxococcaceae bacterium]|nr:hypothetical protein [Myxococcaceae bacterium]
MKLKRDLKRRAMTVTFENAFSLRDAISLPKLVARLAGWREVVLDFTKVKWMRESALMALIPALGSIHDRHVTVRGLEALEVESPALIALAA